MKLGGESGGNLPSRGRSRYDDLVPSDLSAVAYRMKQPDNGIFGLCL